MLRPDTHWAEQHGKGSFGWNHAAVYLNIAETYSLIARYNTLIRMLKVNMLLNCLHLKIQYSTQYILLKSCMPISFHFHYIILVSMKKKKGAKFQAFGFRTLLKHARDYRHGILKLTATLFL